MGYVQRLDDGNTLIGWGATAPAVTEVTPDGKKVLEITFPPGVFSYRAYRANAPQYLAVAPGVVRGLKMAFSGANPATRMTHVALELPTDARVDLAIYDLNGRLVRQALRGAALPAGPHRIAVDVSALPPGMFFCRATARGTRGEVASQGLKLVVAR